MGVGQSGTDKRWGYKVCQGHSAWLAIEAEVGRPYFLAQLAEALATLEASARCCWKVELHRLKGDLLLMQSVEKQSEALSSLLIPVIG